MLEDLKATVQQLEARLQRKDDELQARTLSFQDALMREQERTAQESLRCNELKLTLAQRTQECGQLGSELASLRGVEEELARKEDELKHARREVVELRLKLNEEHRHLEEQQSDKRRLQERHRQEVSDLRCSISVLEHRLQHEQAKAAAQDAQADTLTKALDEVRALREQRDDLDGTLKAELLRFQKDRRGLEQRAEQAIAELREYRSGPSRVDLCAAYESRLDELRWVTLDALQLIARRGGQPPSDLSDTAALRAYVDAVASGSRPHSFRTRGSSFATRRSRESPPCSPRAPGPAQLTYTAPPSPTHAASEEASDDAASDPPLDGEPAALLHRLRHLLFALPRDKQAVLLRRFVDSAQAHSVDGAAVSGLRGFGAACGLPAVGDPPATLVSHIAIVSQERDRLKQELEQALAEKPSAGTVSHRRRGSSSSPPGDASPSSSTGHRLSYRAATSPGEASTPPVTAGEPLSYLAHTRDATRSPAHAPPVLQSPAHATTVRKGRIGEARGDAAIISADGSPKP